jgi:gliding motility-associated-like protein
MKRFYTLIVSLLLVSSTSVFASNYYWVGGSGDWSDINHWATSSGGTLKHIQTPTSLDNVIFDANSLSSSDTVNLNSQSIFCKNFDIENITHNLTFVGICTEWHIYGSVKLNPLFAQNSATMYFDALSGINYIKSNAHPIPADIHFTGQSTWILQDSLHCYNISLESGTFNTSSKKLTIESFISTTNNSRQLTLGTSIISVKEWNVSGTTFSVNAGSSRITINTPYKSFKHSNTGNLTYNDIVFAEIDSLTSLSSNISFHKVQFMSDGVITGDNNYDSLILAFSGDYTLSDGHTQTINQGLLANGDCYKSIYIHANSGNALLSKNSGTVICNYIDLKNVHAGGGAIFYANAGVDLGNNTGWIMQAAISRNLFWVGGNGNWSDTSHWASTSGGAGGECIPIIVDNVIFDNNSFLNASSTSNQVIIPYNNDGICHDFTWQSNVAGTFRFYDDLSISGSCFLGNMLNMSGYGRLYFISDSIGETIETSNINLNSRSLNFNGSGSWELLDSLNNSGGQIYFNNGHLKTLGKYVHVSDFDATNWTQKELSFGNSTIDVDNGFRLFQDYLTIHPNTSNIRMIGQNTYFRTYTYNNTPASLYNVSFVERPYSMGDINNNLTNFNKLSFKRKMRLSGSAKSDTIFFEKGNDYRFAWRSDSIRKALIANGNCVETITMREEDGTNTFNFNMTPTANVNVSYLNLRGSVISGQGTINAINSSDLGLNTGWTFSSSSIPHYWVGGQGNWQDTIHWSYSSGGQGGACIPTISDDVYFDANSFSNNNDTVYIDSMNIYCKNMNWNNATNAPTIYNGSSYVFYISGSLSLIQNMNFDNSGETFFVGEQSNKTIDMASHEFDNRVTLCDTGEWTLLDSLIVNGMLHHHKGKLLANHNLIKVQRYGAIHHSQTLNIQGSTMMISPYGYFRWNQNNQSYLLADSSHIIFLGDGWLESYGYNNAAVDYNNISFMGSCTMSTASSSINVSVNRLFFKQDGIIKGENTIDTLIFSKGGNYHIEAGYNQYITHKWEANGNCHKPISISGRLNWQTSGAADIHVLNGNTQLTNTSIKDLNAIGNGTFTIIDGSNLGGNSSNWQITPSASRTLYWVNNGGNWRDTTHWALSSGGNGGECIPTYKDDVFFDTASFSNATDVAYTSWNTPAIECKDFIWQWTPVNPTMNFDTINVYGSIALGDTMNVTNPNFKMYSLDTSNFIKTSSKKINSINFMSAGGWHLLDNLHSNRIIHKRGSFHSLGNDIFTNDYSSEDSSARLIDIPNTNLYIGHSMKLHSDSLNFISNQSHIQFNDTSGFFTLKILGNTSLNFNEVSFIPVNKLSSVIENKSSVQQHFNKTTINNNAKIYGDNEFDSLFFITGNTYELDYSKIQKINDYWYVRGNNCYAINLQSTKKNNQAHVISTSGTISGDFINMRDIAATGGANFYAGTFSTDIDNNSGWIFTNGPLYVYGLGPDTSVNIGSSIVLNTTNFNGGPNTTYLWSTGSTSPSITVSQTGWYFVTVNYAGNCSVVDSIFVGCRLDMNYNITDDPCNGTSLGSIQAVVPDTSFQYIYQWSTGDTLDYTDSLGAGQYIVTVSADSGLCEAIDTVQINEPPPVICPQGDTAFCAEDSVLINLGNFVDFKWHDLYTGQYRWISSPNSFIVSVQDADGCWSVPDTIHINEDPRPNIDLGEDTSICINESITLEVNKGFEDYLWSDNSTMNSITVYEMGVYWVRVIEKTCVVYDTINIKKCAAKFIVPNVFTPNDDGYNDVFNIDYRNIWDFEVRIYDRWGVKVFQSSNLDKPWDGTVNGRKSAEGVYFWQIIYQEYDGNGGGDEKKIIKGTVTLLRN